MSISISLSISQRSFVKALSTCTFPQCIAYLLVRLRILLFVSIPHPFSDGRILDLSTVDVALGEFLKHVLAELAAADLDAYSLQESAPDLRLRVLGKLLEVQRHMDTRQEGLVERLDSVCGQEENTSVIFDMS